MNIGGDYRVRTECEESAALGIWRNVRLMLIPGQSPSDLYFPLDKVQAEKLLGPFREWLWNISKRKDDAATERSVL